MSDYQPPDKYDEDIDTGTPSLEKYEKLPTLTSKHIFRLRKQNLNLFFEKKNMQKPEN